jgi:hypothetical protein
MMYKGVVTSVQIDQIKNPSTPGQSTWSISTYISGTIRGVVTTTTLAPPVPCSSSGGICGLIPMQEARRDEVRDLQVFDILGYISVLSSSFINPIYYGVSNSLISFDMIFTSAVDANQIFRITRPPGYTMIVGTLVPLGNIVFGASGLDFLRIWSTDFDNPEDMYAEIMKPIAANSRVTFVLTVASPTNAQQVMNWRFSTYLVLPSRDVDGEILNSTVPAYPYIGRDIIATDTSDGAFAGFILVGEVPFTVTPALQTPGARIRLAINFGIADGVESKLYVRMEVTAPLGYLFADSCLFQGSPQFSKCTGFQNMAGMVTVRPRLKGTDLTVYLAVTNPGVTPSPNFFTLALFQDDATQYVRWSRVLGYELVGMSVVFKGNNQLGETGSAFFTFTPVRPSPSSVIYIVIQPPPNSNFHILCTGISPLGFINLPSCTSGSVNDPVTLRFRNASLVAGYAYTVGVMVLNPGGKPLAANNYWGISIQDINQNTFDANLRVPGLDLMTLPIRVNGIGWSTSKPQVIAMVLFQVRLLHMIPAGTLQQFIIRAPEGIMYNEDTSSVSILPVPFPLRLALPIQVNGDELSFYLDTDEDLAPATYNIRFEVSNPSQYPSDNTWAFIAMKDIDVMFVDVKTGYITDQVSPYDVNSASMIANQGDAYRRTGGCLLGLASAFMLSLLLR